MVEVCKKYLPKTACRLDDPRLTIHYEDGLKFIRSRQEEYDLIIVGLHRPLRPWRGPVHPGVLRQLLQSP